MDTAMTVTAYASNKTAADEAVAACKDHVEKLDMLLSPTGPESEIAQLNGADDFGGLYADAARTLPLSPDALALVESSLGMAQTTNGAFDPTIYPVTSAWGFTSGNHRVPSATELASLASRVGYANVLVDNANKTVTVKNGAQLDVGGVAKGFAADELRSLLAKCGVSSALFDLGGNVTAIGSKPNGDPWRVGIANPSNPRSLVGSLDIRNATVSTSGAYQRFFTDDEGRVWHHLINPATGYPADSDAASVSVVGPNGARCDALSTALYVMGTERALAFWREHALQGNDDETFEAVLVDNAGTVHVTAGLESAFVAEGEFADKVVIER